MSDAPPDADAQCMKRLTEGDDLALNDLIHRWRDRLAAFLYRMTGNHEAALDLAQETFVRLYQSRDRYQPTAPFATYLFRIAANLARNHARWRKRHPAVSIEDEQSFVSELREPSSSPDESADHREQLARVERALAALPDDLREAMLLFTYEDMSQVEIANSLGCTTKAVETRIYRARQMLKAALASEPH
ncbi:MAG: sigma-70 family RNA polymerase sigma factor [Verrucomicrobiaceae bacterium]|nr:sigma-70 family RNA polymerase sigma factor [Verrucomicrobiaceae bacterium]